MYLTNCIYRTMRVNDCILLFIYVYKQQITKHFYILFILTYTLCIHNNKQYKNNIYTIKYF